MHIKLRPSLIILLLPIFSKRGVPLRNTNPCFLSLLIYLTTNFLIFQTPPLLAHKIINPHHGHLTNVTKHLHFPNFNTIDIDQSIKFLGNASISKSKFTIQIPYDDASPAVDLTHQSGRAIYSSPIRLYDPLTKTPASFNTTFSFQFTTTTGGGGSDSGDGGNGGSGLAFIIVPDEFTVGRSGPWLGMLNDACDNSYKSVAVEFDSSYDPDFGDPNDDHVGINLGQVVSFKTAYTSLSDVSLHDGSVHRAWITYDAHSKLLDAYLGLDGGCIPKNPILSTPLDLSHHLKEYMFVGFSASTGNSTQVHNILSWNFSSISQAYLKVPNVTTTCHRNVAHQVAKYSGVPRTSQLSSFVIFLIVLGLCFLACVIYYCNTKLQLKEHSMNYPLSERKQKPISPTTPRSFTIHEMYKATKGFGKDEVLNNDTRGVLYRGVLPNGCRVSVKRFLNERLDKRREMSKRVNEMTRISQAHPGLVTIRGWCYDCREVIVISDYYPNGSLDKWLFGIGVVPWTRRFKLISDVAETLSYLHSQEIAHGNLKTSSVFLDLNYGAVLGDYGFGRYCNESSRVEPMSGKRYDVFEFGMLVLEIVSGKRAVGDSDGGEEEMGLLGFACAMHERGEMVEVVDKMLGSSFDSGEAIRLLEIGMSCTWSDGPPSMGEVVEFLNMQKPIPKLPTNRSAMSSSL